MLDDDKERDELTDKVTEKLKGLEVFVLVGVHNNCLKKSFDTSNLNRK